jgi:predicted acyltransferase (DUF342 family)
MRKTAAAAALLPIFMVPPAGAEPITDFALFGGSSTSIGSNVSVNGGFVGSNGNASLGSNVDTLGVLGGGNFVSGGNSAAHPTGNIIFNGNVSIPSNAVVSGSIDAGGNVTTGPISTVNGSIRAGGSVNVQSIGQVLGQVDAGAAAGTAVTLGPLAQVGGTITHKPGTTTSGVSLPNVAVTGIPTPPTPFGGVTLPGAHSFSAGLTNVIKPANTTTSLLPGSYDDLSLGANNVLNLSAGTYHFDTWMIANNAVLNLDLTGGAISLYFTGDVSIASNFIMNLAGGNASLVYAETLSDWLMGDNINWFGTILGSGQDSDVTLGNNHHLTGAAYANHDLRLGDNSIVTFMLWNGSNTPQAVALPATPWLLGACLIALAALRRRTHLR